jgi:hypothetical protein
MLARVRMTATMKSKNLVGAVALLALALPSCSEDGIDECSHRVCDIREPSCVEFVAKVVACQRGVPEVMPTIRFATAQEVLDEREAPTTQQLDDARDYWAGEALVGLMPEGYDPASEGADSLSGVLAQYRPSTDEIVVISDSNIPDDETGYRVMVHEMIHAVQDADYDLEALWQQYATTFPRSLGFRAAVEGEAVLYTALADIELAGFPPSQADWDRYFGEWKHDMLVAATETEVPSLSVNGLFPYAFGGEQVLEAWEDNDLDGVRDYVQHPPDSVRQVMAGYRQRPPAVFNLDTELNPHAVPVLPGHTYLGGGGQDAWLLNTMLQRIASSTELWASTALAAVGADHLSVWRDDASGARVAVWRLLTIDSALDSVLVGGASQWVAVREDATTHYAQRVEDGWVLVAVEAGTAVEVADAITGWQSQDEATERAGLERSAPRRGLVLGQHHGLHTHGL